MLQTVVVRKAHRRLYFWYLQHSHFVALPLYSYVRKAVQRCQSTKGNIERLPTSGSIRSVINQEKGLFVSDFWQEHVPLARLSLPLGFHVEGPKIEMTPFFSRRRPPSFDALRCAVLPKQAARDRTSQIVFSWPEERRGPRHSQLVLSRCIRDRQVGGASLNKTSMCACVRRSRRQASGV